MPIKRAGCERRDDGEITAAARKEQTIAIQFVTGGRGNRSNCYRRECEDLSQTDLQIFDNRRLKLKPIPRATIRGSIEFMIPPTQRQTLAIKASLTLC